MVTGGCQGVNMVWAILGWNAYNVHRIGPTYGEIHAEEQS
jgi:hypothetical protein